MESESSEGKLKPGAMLIHCLVENKEVATCQYLAASIKRREYPILPESDFKPLKVYDEVDKSGSAEPFIWPKKCENCEFYKSIEGLLD